METQEKWTVIKLLATVRAKLDMHKKAHSYSEYINTMLLYFEAVNISPSSFSTHPGIELKKDIERLIKIIRAIEKDKINAVVENTRICKEALTKTPVMEIQTQKGQLENIFEQLNFSGDEKITMDDFIRFIEVNKEQANEITELRTECEKLKKQMLISPPKESDIGLNSKLILELIGQIENHSKNENGKFTVDMNLYAPYMGRIKDELKNVCENS